MTSIHDPEIGTGSFTPITDDITRLACVTQQDMAGQSRVTTARMSPGNTRVNNPLPPEYQVGRGEGAGEVTRYR